MRNFDYDVANRVDEAFSIDAGQTMAIAGGTELLNWFRLGIAAPDKIIEIGRIAGLEAIERSGACRSSNPRGRRSAFDSAGGGCGRTRCGARRDTAQTR